MNQVIYFKDRLNLHEQNSQLFNRYIKCINKSQQDILTQYSQVSAMYSQLIEVYPDALLILMDRRIIHANAHAYKLLEITPKNILLLENFQNYFTPECTQKINEILSNTDSFTKTLVELKIITRSGKRLDVEAFFNHSHERGAHVFMISLRDISDKKLQAEMSQQFEMERLKLEFFSTLSHELKTPVNVIYSAIQLQNDLIASQESDKAYKYNIMISQNCMRLLKLLNNLLDINRIGSDHFKVSPQHINVALLTEDILDSISAYARKKNISVLFDTEFEEIYTYIDPDLFERILLNLFSNAIKYTPDSGHLWINLFTNSTTVFIAIKDDGVGIPPDKLQTIFERFVRIDNGLVRQAEGAGIGLSLVKSFVELNQGTICVNSHLGGGSEFTLAFPLESTHFIDNFSYSYTSIKDKIDIEFSDVFI